MYEDICRVRLMLHHPFREFKDLLILDDIGDQDTHCATYAEAYPPLLGTPHYLFCRLL
jgi:hypothetical protein